MDDTTLIMDCEDVDIKIEPGVAYKVLSTGSPTNVTSPEVPPIVIKPDPSTTSPEESVFIGHIKIAPDTLDPDPGDNKPGDHQESQTPGDSLQVTIGPPDSAFTSFQPRNYEETKHICAVCGKRYKRKNGLKQHSLSHTGEKPFKCTVCDKGFYRKTHLNQHSLYHTGENQFKCAECDKAFDLYSSLRRHQCDRPHKCLSCNFSFKHEQMLIVHQRIHHGRIVEIASMPIQQEKPAREKLGCYEHDISYEGITKCVVSTIHQKANILQKPFQCTVCDNSFPLARNLKDQQLVHSGVKPHTCNVCGKQFCDVSNLERHQLLHTGEKPNVDYGRLMQTTSVGVVTETGEKPFKYAECDKAFFLDSSLEQHHCVHSGDRPHNCLSCNLSFKQEKKVTVHEKIHHDPGDNSVVNVNSPLHQEKPPGVKPYKHDLCKNDITKYVDSAIQQNTQILHKAFQCTVCDKALLSTSDLKQHQRVHSGNSAYICLLCGLHFRQKQTLIAHHRIHHGSSEEIINMALQQEKHMLLQQEKPPVGKFPCTVCDKSFSLAGILEAHQLVHSRAKPHTCDVCGKPFCDVSNLERHKLLHTGTLTNDTSVVKGFN